MKKALVVFMIFSLFYCSNKKEYEYYPDGNIKKVCKKKGDTQKCETYYITGNIRTSYSLKKDKHHGKIRGYYDNGNIWFEEIYNSDKREGVSMEYFENGKVKMKSRFKNDLLHGYHTIYSETGIMSSKSLYENDTLIILKRNIVSYDSNYKMTQHLRVQPNDTVFIKNGNLVYDSKGQLLKDLSSYYTVKEKPDTLYRGDSIKLDFEFYPQFEKIKLCVGDFDKYLYPKQSFDTINVENNRCSYSFVPSSRETFFLKGVIIEYKDDILDLNNSRRYPFAEFFIVK